MPYKEQRGNRRRRMLVVFAVVAIGGAAGVGVRLAAAAEDPTAADATVQTSTEPVHEHATTTAEDYVRIQDAQAVAAGAAAGPQRLARHVHLAVRPQRRRRHRNSDNFITSPGVSNAAHHTHDYVGNLSTDGNSTNESLAAAGTTCRFGDKSTYFWPVIRDIRPTGDDADQPGGGADGNLGKIIVPERGVPPVPRQRSGQGRADATVPAHHHRRRQGRDQWAERPERQGPLDLLRHSPTGSAPRSMCSARAGSSSSG